MEMEKEKELLICCPSCKEFIIIEKLNCGIFRHGILKSNGNQIDPHASEEQCTYLKKKDLIIGCGIPFKISLKNIDINSYMTVNEDTINVEICDYI